ncbi:hypothetical protein [Rhizobium sp. GCM10022189]|uniref:hypothetical protein n=1 Tax=Rhizobium sp. GCM10022189 TaxID=3252654 RepID=UPI00361B5C30
MKPERTRILLIVGSNIVECHRTARAFGLDLTKVGSMRTVTRPYALRSWSRGTPFIALNRDSWPETLDRALDALTRTGQLRIANEKDLEDLREEEGLAHAG